MSGRRIGQWVGFCILLLANDLYAQTAEPVSMPDGSPLPRTAWSSPNPRLPQLPFRVWNAYEGLRPRSKPEGGEIGSPLSFGQRLVVLAVYRDKVTKVDAPPQAERSDWVRSGWVLVGKELSSSPNVDGPFEVLGWVEGKYLAQEEAIKDPTSRVHRKAWLKRDIRGLRKEEKGFQLKATGGGQLADTSQSQFIKSTIQGLKAPHPGAAPHAEVRFSEFFFVFGATGDSPEIDYVLLGTEYQLADDVPGGVERRLLGWFPRLAVELWHTREALQWSEVQNRPPGRIYLSPQDALKAGPDGSNSDVRPLFEERFIDNKPIPMGPADPRFPILVWEEGLTFWYRNRHRFPPGWKLLKVGVEGGYVDEEGHPIALAEEIRDLQNKLRQIEEALTRLEILLVIDDTESMAPWFPVAARALESVVEDIRSRKWASVALAITYYSDVDPGDLKFSPIRTQKLTSDPAEISKRLNELRNHKVSRGGDPRELVFQGLVRGIREAGFHPLSTKLVILLGDDADKSDENDPNHEAERRVVNELVSFHVPAHFYAIQAFPEERLHERPVAAAFRKQMETLVNLYRMHPRIKESEFQARLLSTNDASRVVQDVAMYVQAVRDQQSIWAAQLQQLRRGDFTARIGPAMEMVIRHLGLEERVSRLKAEKGFQLYSEGYTWHPLGENQQAATELVLLLSRADVESIVFTLREVFNELGDNFDPKKFREILDKALGEKTRDFWEQMVAATALVGASERLQRFIDPTAEISLEDLYHLQGALVRLEDILGGVEYTYVRREGSGVWVRAGEPKPAIRFFKSHTGEVSWVWIRVRDEWP